MPRAELPQILRHIQATAAEYDLVIANVFHAGDGNIHPVPLFDERVPDQVRRVLAASTAIHDECIRLGGSVTGEHGTGVDFTGYKFNTLDRRITRRMVFRKLDSPAESVQCLRQTPAEIEEL